MSRTVVHAAKLSNDCFYQGAAVILGDLARGYSPSLAADIMQSNGITMRQLEDAGVEEFDLKPLRYEARLREKP